MTDDDEQIPTHGKHRGVGLHAGQNAERLAIVRRDIDAAHALTDLEQLVEFADDVGRAPEARLWARAKAIATIDDRIERRAPRARATDLSRERINASAVGLDKLRCRSTTHYATIYDNYRCAVRREVPLPPRQYNRIPPSN